MKSESIISELHFGDVFQSPRDDIGDYLRVVTDIGEGTHFYAHRV
jgi:hypothetical protein